MVAPSRMARIGRRRRLPLRRPVAVSRAKPRGTGSSRKKTHIPLTLASLWNQRLLANGLATVLFEQRRLRGLRGLEAEMRVRVAGSHPAPWRALEEANLHQIRLVDIHDRIPLLPDLGCDRFDNHRGAVAL